MISLLVKRRRASFGIIQVEEFNGRMESNPSKTKAQKGTETDQVTIHFW
jgi:hypothetical protein